MQRYALIILTTIRNRGDAYTRCPKVSILSITISSIMLTPGQDCVNVFSVPSTSNLSYNCTTVASVP